MTPIRAERRARQAGVSLVVVLLILIVVALLGAGAAQMSLLSERTTRADRDKQIAFQAAESALEDAYADIIGGNDSLRAPSFLGNNRQGFVAGCNNDSHARGLCLPSLTATDKAVWLQVDFTDSSATANTVAIGTFTGRLTYAASGVGLMPSKLARYIIEVVDDQSPQAPPGAVIYRVTAMGFGPSPDSRVVLQGEFRRPAS